MNKQELENWLDGPHVGVCSGCGRKTWSVSEVGKWCNMPQPSGEICVGVLKASEADSVPSPPDNE